MASDASALSGISTSVRASRLRWIVAGGMLMVHALAVSHLAFSSHAVSELSGAWVEAGDQNHVCAASNAEEAQVTGTEQGGQAEDVCGAVGLLNHARLVSVAPVVSVSLLPPHLLARDEARAGFVALAVLSRAPKASPPQV